MDGQTRDRFDNLAAEATRLVDADPECMSARFNSDWAWCSMRFIANLISAAKTLELAGTYGQSATDLPPLSLTKRIYSLATESQGRLPPLFSWESVPRVDAIEKTEKTLRWGKNC